MSEQQIEANRLLVNRFYHEFWNEMDFEIAEEIVTPDITFHGALGTQTNGINGLTTYVKQLHDVFPDFRRHGRGRAKSCGLPHLSWHP
jgi:hypothetical protein